MPASTSDLATMIGEAKAIFVDWDGCLAQDGRLLPGAADFLRKTAPRSFIISNNSTHLPEDFQTFLAREGVNMSVGRILLAGHQTLGYVAQVHEGRRIHLVANDRLKAHAHQLGIAMVEARADVVVLLRDTGFTYETLQLAANQLRSGAQLIVANPDLTHPGSDGAIVPETGALLAALGACVDLSTLELEIIGKPSNHLFDFALSRADVTPDEALMIGDNPMTDVAGAEKSGIRAILLEHGVTCIATLAQAASFPPPPEVDRRSWL